MESIGASTQAMGITPVMGHFLDELVKNPPGPMSQLVSRLHVDPGWVTDIVDRLEARGYVTRRPSASDRRVKVIQVTPAGRRTWDEIQDLMYSPPAAVNDLPEEDLRALLRIGERISAAQQPEPQAAEAAPPPPESDLRSRHRRARALADLERERRALDRAAPRARAGRHRTRPG